MGDRIAKEGALPIPIDIHLVFCLLICGQPQTVPSHTEMTTFSKAEKPLAVEECGKLALCNILIISSLSIWVQQKSTQFSYIQLLGR